MELLPSPLTVEACQCSIVLPCMASLVAKKKANTLYYYVVESARVDGKPRIVHQTYLGTAERVAALVKDRTAPLPLSATTIDYGLPGALWLAAQNSGVFLLLESLWPKPRSGPSTAHYFLLAAIHRICQPGPKTEVADWYRRSILHSLWGFPPERFSSQAFWDCFDQISPGGRRTARRRGSIEEAQLRLLGVWKEKQLVGRRLLAYDTTNFYTYIASTNTRRIWHNAATTNRGGIICDRWVSAMCWTATTALVCATTSIQAMSPMPKSCPSALARIVGMLDHQQIARDSVTLVFDKGSAALANTLELEQAGVGWISALPWNQAPAELREREMAQILD